MTDTAAPILSPTARFRKALGARDAHGDTGEDVSGEFTIAEQLLIDDIANFDRVRRAPFATLVPASPAALPGPGRRVGGRSVTLRRAHRSGPDDHLA